MGTSSVTVFLTISFAERDRGKTRSDYVSTVINTAKEKVLYHHADIVQISGGMFDFDITNFRKILGISPFSMKPMENGKYFTVFKVSKNKLLESKV